MFHQLGVDSPNHWPFLKEPSVRAEPSGTTEILWYNWSISFLTACGLPLLKGHGSSLIDGTQ